MAIILYIYHIYVIICNNSMIIYNRVSIIYNISNKYIKIYHLSDTYNIQYTTYDTYNLKICCI